MVIMRNRILVSVDMIYLEWMYELFDNDGIYRYKIED
jgi:hypothetical protein